MSKTRRTQFDAHRLSFGRAARSKISSRVHLQSSRELPAGLGVLSLVGSSATFKRVGEKGIFK